MYILILLASCTSQEVCDNTGQSELIARFKTMEEGLVKDSIISGVSVYGIREGQSDSLLYNSETVSRIVLPLDSHQDYSRFILNINEQSDTLRINHRTEFYMVSYTCGFATLFTLENVDHSFLMVRDYEIRKALVDVELEQDEEHLWLYF